MKKSLGYIFAFLWVTFFVVGLLESADWAAKALKWTVNPIYLATGAACAFYAMLKIADDDT